MTEIKKLIESAVTVFVAQDENEQGIVISKQSLLSLITTIESQQKENDYKSMLVESYRKQIDREQELIDEQNVQIESQKEEIAELLRVNSVKSQQLFENDLEISLLEKDIQDWHKHYKDKLDSQKAITELAVKGLKEVSHDIHIGSTCAKIAKSTLSEIERLSHE